MSLGVAIKYLNPSRVRCSRRILVLVALIMFIQKRPRGLFPQKGLRRSTNHATNINGFTAFMTALRSDGGGKTFLSILFAVAVIVPILHWQYQSPPHCTCPTTHDAHLQYSVRAARGRVDFGVGYCGILSLGSAAFFAWAVIGHVSDAQIGPPVSMAIPSCLTSWCS